MRIQYQPLPPIKGGQTEALKFRRGGRLAASDEILLNGSPLKLVNNFTYLGIVSTTSETSVLRHIDEWPRKTLAASSIADPYRLSLETACKLFTLKLAPCAAYGIELIWEHLSERDLLSLDRAKTTFLKRVLGVHSNTRTRLVYLLTGEKRFMEGLQQKLNLEKKTAFTNFILNRGKEVDSAQWSESGNKSYLLDRWVDLGQTSQASISALNTPAGGRRGSVGTNHHGETASRKMLITSQPLHGFSRSWTR